MLLSEMLSGRRLILASASPRRRQLLAGLDVEFEPARPFEVQERWPENLAPEQVPQYLSALKSESYPYELLSGDILLTADTVVVTEGRILGKPVSEEDACRMLSQLSGRTHKVITGVTLRDRAGRRTFSAESSVRFRVLDAEEIEYYVRRYRPLDKAGSYGIQEWIGYAGIESIEGSFYNVMGLPVQRLYAELKEFCERT